MNKIRWSRAFGFAIIGSLSSLMLSAQAGDPAVLQQKLYAQFRLTTTTPDRSGIVTAGDVVVIHRAGLLMYAVASPLPPSNTYKNGKISQGWGGFGKDMLITMAAPGGATATDYPHRQFVPEEKCWVKGIQVEKDGVLFQLYSDPYDDIRYYANLKIPFPNKKEMPPVDAVMQTVAEVLTAVRSDDQAGQGEQPAPNQTAAGQAAPPMAAATNFASAPMPDIPPPPPPPDIAPPPPPADAPPPVNAPPPTIALNQTMDQVTAGFGQPLKVAKLGTMVIFYYKDMKVTFRNGKVSNVE
jgi:hypothetical protein